MEWEFLLIEYANTNNTNFETNFSNLDVMIKGLYPNWSYSILYLPYSCHHILFVQLEN
jgi:hypothetical protein